MRTMILRLTALLALVLGTAGCTDGSTPLTPASDISAVADQQQTAAGCCVLDPVVVVVPGCDPYTSLDWCQGDGGDDQCMASTPSGQTVLGCNDSGGTPGTCPTWDVSCQPTDGAGGTPPGTTDPACDPTVDPACHKPLTGADSAAISLALVQYLRPLSSIQDETARRQCEHMANAFDTLYRNGRVHRGAYTTMTGDPGAVPHTGAWDPNTGRMHIDPRYLDLAARGGEAALRELLDTLLHEAAHALDLDHPNGYVSSPWGPVFSDPYFNLLTVGANSCLNW